MRTADGCYCRHVFPAAHMVTLLPLHAIEAGLHVSSLPDDCQRCAHAQVRLGSGSRRRRARSSWRTWRWRRTRQGAPASTSP
jgi:hypothetical protein